MNDQVRWDQSLVKKYRSSNHFKLLNQLRNEVKKYPLNNKKNISTKEKIETKTENANKTVISKHQNAEFSKNSTITNNNNKSTISFNNSKNFSIYNNMKQDSAKINNDSEITESKHLNDDSTSSSFINRLNQVDMK